MEIKTKLDLGDALYFMRKNKVTCGKIVSIKTISELTHPSTNLLGSKTHIIYFVDVLENHGYSGIKLEINEEFAFGTKEKLLESLWKNI